MVVLVTGAHGQLGKSLQYIASDYPNVQFLFYSSSDLDITNLADCNALFSEIKPDYCINTAAYTAVDKAESEEDKAISVNVTGTRNIAEVCKNNNVVLLHVSTDFVFDGNKKHPYTETDLPNPTGVYGQTKLDGEKAIQSMMNKYYIIRTSWVYSQFGHNFMKTMLRLASERDSLSVVNDQIGTPTNAVDLARALVQIILSDNKTKTDKQYGVYNYSNEGQCSWYDFARAIFDHNGVEVELKPIPTSDFPTPAKRPPYSVLDKSKIKKTFGITNIDWEESLKTVKI